MGDAAERWHDLVGARLDEVERLSPDGRGVGAEFWNRRARRYQARATPAVDDPFLSRVRPYVGPRTTVLDAGSGPGRFTLALAPRAARVVAVDPSERMLALVRRSARERSLTNVSTVLGRFEEVDPGAADVAICSFVLPVVADAGPFVRKLDATARRRVFLYMSAWSSDAAVDPFWRHFHGAPRLPPPTHLDAAALVREEVGADPRVRVVELPTRGRFASVDEAVADYRDWLLLPDTAAVRRELAGLLGSWLVRRGGSLRPPFRTTPAAVVDWEPQRS